MHEFLPRLRERSDRRALVLLAMLSALLIAPWWGAWRSPWLLPPTALLVFVACIIKHNHVHCRTFTTRFWNAVLNLWLTLLTGQPATGIITVHNERHHRHANTEHDFVRTSLVRSRSNVVNFLLFAPRSVADMYRRKPSDLRAWRRRARGLYRLAVIERASIYALAVALLWCDWKTVLLYWALPCAFGQWALVTMNLLQHQDCAHDSTHNHSRNITGRFANWLFFNNGFHTAHHLRPGLHWSRLREFHERELALHIAPELNERSLFGAIWRRLRATPQEAGR